MRTIPKEYAVVNGIVFALALVFMGLFLSGGGDGWLSAAFVSFFSIPMIPTAFANFLNPKPSIQVSIGLVAAIGVLDLRLLVVTLDSEWRVFLNTMKYAPILFWTFIILWFLWQLLPFIVIYRHSAA